MKSSWPVAFVVAAIAILRMTQANSDEPGKAPTAVGDLMRGKDAGQVRDDNGLKMKLVWCPPGKFTMGSPETETPRLSNEAQVDVNLTRGFWFGKFEVTRSEWKQLMATEPWKGKSVTDEGDEFPAVWVNRQDAMDFCRKLTKDERRAGRMPEGWEYTLPTEAEWERACRAGTETRFNFGDDRSKLGEYAWFDDTGFTRAGNGHPVGLKKPNLWGLHDMHGNVWEWCRDCYADKLPGGRDPKVTEQDTECVIRGGCVGFWCHKTEGVDNYRSARRSSLKPSYANQHLGFRVAFSPTGNM